MWTAINPVYRAAYEQALRELKALADPGLRVRGMPEPRLNLVSTQPENTEKDAHHE
jgi:hypothetical protein